MLMLLSWVNTLVVFRFRYSKLDDTSWSTVNLRTSRTASSLPRRYAFTATDMLLRDTGHRDTGTPRHGTQDTGTREHGNTGHRATLRNGSTTFTDFRTRKQSDASLNPHHVLYVYFRHGRHCPQEKRGDFPLVRWRCPAEPTNERPRNDSALSNEGISSESADQSGLPGIKLTWYNII